MRAYTMYRIIPEYWLDVHKCLEEIQSPKSPSLPSNKETLDIRNNFALTLILMIIYSFYEGGGGYFIQPLFTLNRIRKSMFFGFF